MFRAVFQFLMMKMLSRQQLLQLISSSTCNTSNLLKVVCCGCKTSQCTSFKHVLKCTLVCGKCRGVSCMNCEEGMLQFNGDHYFIL